MLDTCAPDCSAGDFDRMHYKYTVANVAWGVAGVSAVTGLVLYLTRPTVKEPARSQAMLTVTPVFPVDPDHAARGAALELRGRF